MDYELTFVVSGTSVDDTDAVETLENELDAMLFRGGGVDLLTIVIAGDNATDAAMQAVSNIERAVSDLQVLRLDRNLVGVAEIAQRTGRSRQNVSQWINGDRQGKTPFPLPEGTAGRSHVWLWSEVNRWLRGISLDDGFEYPTRDEMAIIDSALIRARQKSTRASVAAHSDAMIVPVKHGHLLVDITIEPDIHGMRFSGFAHTVPSGAKPPAFPAPSEFKPLNKVAA
ncbi:helix-turn-helix transcriptional regulator [Kitasatospora sp. NPDC057198]|uniref:helix-turn-helix transcriptional regulator n=1 Tax=Kitasatospora sp. NPDC057198 TaxID=3346046 RepID=UPI0036428C8F